MMVGTYGAKCSPSVEGGLVLLIATPSLRLRGTWSCDTETWLQVGAICMDDALMDMASWKLLLMRRMYTCMDDGMDDWMDDSTDCCVESLYCRSMQHHLCLVQYVYHLILPITLLPSQGGMCVSRTWRSVSTVPPPPSHSTPETHLARRPHWYGRTRTMWSEAWDCITRRTMQAVYPVVRWSSPTCLEG
jgi:hypothetical protein